MRRKIAAFIGALMVVPTVGGVWFTEFEGKSAAAKFLIGFAVTLVAAAPSALFTFVPALWVLGRVTRPTWWKVWLLGAICGLASYLPFSYVSYQSSGADSGPPEGTYLEYLIRSGLDPFIFLMAGAGLLTAAAYHLLSRPPREGPG